MDTGINNKTVRVHRCEKTTTHNKQQKGQVDGGVRGGIQDTFVRGHHRRPGADDRLRLQGPVVQPSSVDQSDRAILLHGVCLSALDVLHSNKRRHQQQSTRPRVLEGGLERLDGPRQEAAPRARQEDAGALHVHGLARTQGSRADEVRWLVGWPPSDQPSNWWAFQPLV